jgi:hypothetical protein
MAKTYEVLELSYINGQLYEAGEIVELEINDPGSNLKLVKPEKKPAPAKAADDSQGQGDA